MAAADTIDAWDGEQDLASWPTTLPEIDPDTGDTINWLITTLSMVKTNDGSFWIAEDAGDAGQQVRRVFPDGSQLVYDIVDQISPLLPFGLRFGVQDMILATDGDIVWLVILANTNTFLGDKSVTCPTVPVQKVRKLVSSHPAVAVFGSTPPPSGTFAVSGDHFYIIDIDPAQTALWGNGTPGDTDPGNTAYGNPALPLDTVGGNGWPPLNLRFGFTACASPAEPGVLHFIWGEAGYAGEFDPCAFHDFGDGGGDYICRLSYCRASGLLITDQFDLFSSTSGWSDLGKGIGVPDVPDACFCNALLKNDAGSPVAFVNMVGSYSDGDVIFQPIGVIPKDYVEMWDLSLGAPEVIQNSTGVVPPDLESLILTTNFGTSDGNDLYMGPPFNNQIRSAPLYDDPLLGGTPVYLIAVMYRLASTRNFAWFVMRVPADGSGPFEFLDGNLGAGIGIGPDAGADFVSEPRNVWWPSGALFGSTAAMMQYDRVCAHAWLADAESPTEQLVVNVRGIDLDGELISFVSQNSGGTMFSLTQQVILRNYYPCNSGMHVWETIS